MPVTPAHAAVAWPLSRIAPALPPAAVAIGALSPDFEYLLRLAPSGRFGHTALGIVVFCLPLSLLVWAVFERSVRPTLLDLLPPGMRRLADFSHPLEPHPWTRRWALAALASTLGALTHVAWDSFTHQTGWSVARLPFLAGASGLPGLGPWPWYKVLQHASSAGGLILLALWAARALTRIPPELKRFDPGQRARALRTAAALLATSAAAGVLNALRAQGRPLAVLLGYAAVGCMVGLAIALLALAATHRRAADRSN
jgi:hypothetical protein